MQGTGVRTLIATPFLPRGFHGIAPTQPINILQGAGKLLVIPSGWFALARNSAFVSVTSASGDPKKRAVRPFKRENKFLLSAK